jgi:hypothetical protein
VSEVGSRTAIEQGHVCEDKEDFIELLRWWFETTDEETVGDVEPFRGKPWTFVETASGRCHLNADTARAGVRKFLELAASNGSRLQWRVVANQAGNVNKVAFGPDSETVKNFYLYTDTNLAAPTTL